MNRLYYSMVLAVLSERYDIPFGRGGAMRTIRFRPRRRKVHNKHYKNRKPEKSNSLRPKKLLLLNLSLFLLSVYGLYKLKMFQNDFKEGTEFSTPLFSGLLNPILNNLFNPHTGSLSFLYPLAEIALTLCIAVFLAMFVLKILSFLYL